MKYTTYTVIYVVGGDINWQFFECEAFCGDDAEELCMNEIPDASVIWVNEGKNRTMD